MHRAQSLRGKLRTETELRTEIETAVPTAQLLGYVKDRTATNRAAMKLLQANDPTIVVLPCALPIA
jgi:hypothetical protein